MILISNTAHGRNVLAGIHIVIMKEIRVLIARNIKPLLILVGPVALIDAVMLQLSISKMQMRSNNVKTI